VVAHGFEDFLAGAVDGAHVILFEFEALLLHPAVVAVAHLELVDVTELGGSLVDQFEELRFGTDTGDFEGRRQPLRGR